jgi:hypothetical protein
MDFSSLSSFHLDASVIIASVFWGGLGTGVAIYGKKQQSATALFGGIALIAISYFIAESALWMSVAGVAIVAGMWWWSRNN